MSQYLTKHYAVRHSDRILCQRWAEVTNAASAKGRPIQPADAWIAATALAMNIPLVTNNPADFAGVDGLKVLTKATT
jgi:predicted nucleic acid-binding protein